MLENIVWIVVEMQLGIFYLNFAIFAIFRYNMPRGGNIAAQNALKREEKEAERAKKHEQGLHMNATRS